MNFQCDCGHVIRDQTGDLPYKAQLLPDQAWNAVHETIHKALAAFAEAVQEDRRDEWIAQHFLEAYPRDLSHEAVISDYLSGMSTRLRRMYQCEKCGTIFIEKEPGGVFVRFRPVDQDWQDILACK
jgi:hypothetical protein